MGCTLHVSSALREVLGYKEVRGCALGTAGESRLHCVELADGGQLEFVVDYFDAESDPFPYEAGQFDTVLCCELLEHLQKDPVKMIEEINRVLQPGGVLVLTTQTPLRSRLWRLCCTGSIPDCM
jgi:2-polyprenyl-3-methyl-5-hydroxy-6-metoxy-1,4-benzoquinol methylase